jgi:hypothetical protein
MMLTSTAPLLTSELLAAHAAALELREMKAGYQSYGHEATKPRSHEATKPRSHEATAKYLVPY